MGDPHQSFRELAEAWLGKFSIFLIYIGIGIAVQLGMYDKNQKLTGWQRFWRAILSICAGAIASLLCNAWHWEKVAMVIVPTTTLIGQSLFEYILRKWPLIADYWLDKITSKKAEPKNGNQ